MLIFFLNIVLFSNGEDKGTKRAKEGKTYTFFVGWKYNKWHKSSCGNEMKLSFTP